MPSMTEFPRPSVRLMKSSKNPKPVPRPEAKSTVRIHNLSLDLTSEEVEEIFSIHGQILEVARDPKFPRAEVSFVDSFAAHESANDLLGLELFRGQPLFLEVVRGNPRDLEVKATDLVPEWEAKHVTRDIPDRGLGPRVDSAAAPVASARPTGASISVSNLTKVISNPELYELFSHFGKILRFERLDSNVAIVCYGRKESAHLAAECYDGVYFANPPHGPSTVDLLPEDFDEAGVENEVKPKDAKVSEAMCLNCSQSRVKVEPLVNGDPRPKARRARILPPSPDRSVAGSNESLRSSSSRMVHRVYSSKPNKEQLDNDMDAYMARRTK